MGEHPSAYARPARPSTDQHVVCRAPESYHAHVHEAATRLTNGFSKKWENLKAALALNFAYYNLCRVHQTLRVTPAVEAGITDRIWTISDLLGAVTT